MPQCAPPVEADLDYKRRRGSATRYRPASEPRADRRRVAEDRHHTLDIRICGVPLARIGGATVMYSGMCVRFTACLQHANYPVHRIQGLRGSHSFTASPLANMWRAVGTHPEERNTTGE